MKQRKPEGYVNDTQETEPWDTPRNFFLSQRVKVELYQRIPPGDDEGEWKNTGRFFTGYLVNGPGSRLQDPDNGDCWYVIPHHPIDYGGDGKYMTTHPRTIDEKERDPYESDEALRGQVSLRLAVVAMDHEVEIRSE